MLKVYPACRTASGGTTRTRSTRTCWTSSAAEPPGSYRAGTAHRSHRPACAPPFRSAAPGPLARDHELGVPVGPVRVRRADALLVLAVRGLGASHGRRPARGRAVRRGPGPIRPGSRFVTSWSSQLLPSGPSKVANSCRSRARARARPPGRSCCRLELRPRRAGVNVSLTGRPARPQLRGAGLDVVDHEIQAVGRARGRPSSAAAPNWIEHPDPGGVNCTMRTPLSNERSASSRQPSPP